MSRISPASTARGVALPELSVASATNKDRYIGPGSVLVVYNLNNADSVAIAQYYQQVRVIPAANMLGVSLLWTEVADGTAMSSADANANLIAYVAAKLAMLDIRSIVTCGRWPNTVDNLDMFTVLGMASYIYTRPTNSRFSAVSDWIPYAADFLLFREEYSRHPRRPLPMPSASLTVAFPYEMIPPVGYAQRSYGGSSRTIIPHFRLEVSPTESTDTRIPNPSDVNYVKRIINDGIATEAAKYTDLGTVLCSASGSYSNDIVAGSISNVAMAQGSAVVSVHPSSTAGTVNTLVGTPCYKSSVTAYITAGSSIAVVPSYLVDANRPMVNLPAGTPVTALSADSALPLFAPGTTILASDTVGLTYTLSAPAIKSGNMFMGGQISFEFAPSNTLIQSIDGLLQLTLSNPASISLSGVNLSTSVRMQATGLVTGFGAYNEVVGGMPCTLYSRALYSELQYATSRNTSFATLGLYADPSTRAVYALHVAGVTSASAVPLDKSRTGALTVDGTAVWRYLYDLPTDAYPPGSTDIDNRGGESGSVFTPINDVFIRAVGVNSYFGGNREPDRAEDYAYRRGAIAVFSQSFSATPCAINGRDYDFGAAHFDPAYGTNSTTASIGATASGSVGYLSSVNRLNRVTNPFTLYSSNASSTRRITAIDTLQVTDAVHGTVVVSWAGTNKTLREVFAYIKANLPAGWGITTLSGGVPSRAMTALKNGACFSYGCWAEPYTNGASKTHYLFHNLIAGLSTGETMYSVMATMYHRYTHIYGDPLYRPFGYRISN